MGSWRMLSKSKGKSKMNNRLRMNSNNKRAIKINYERIMNLNYFSSSIHH